MVDLKLRNIISFYNPEAVLFDNPSFDNSIIGLTNTGSIIYDMDKMVAELSEESNMTPSESLEFINYNTLRILHYINKYKPIILEISREDMESLK